MTIRTPYVTTNRLYVTIPSGRRILTSRARASKELIGWEARAGYAGAPVQGPLRASFALYHKDRRKRDLDNVKGLVDALTGILWEDDSQLVELLITKGLDKADPRVEVSVSPVTPLSL